MSAWNDMTDSTPPGRKTLGIKTTSPSDAPRKAKRPVRVSDLNRKRVQDVVTAARAVRRKSRIVAGNFAAAG